jgi:hypothetical protein
MNGHIVLFYDGDMELFIKYWTTNLEKQMSERKYEVIIYWCEDDNQSRWQHHCNDLMNTPM